MEAVIFRFVFLYLATLLAVSPVLFLHLTTLAVCLVHLALLQRKQKPSFCSLREK